MKIYELENGTADTVLIQPVDDYDLDGIEKEFALIKAYLTIIKIIDFKLVV